MIDDMGFGAIESFGGLIRTPNIDRLVRNGLRFTNFHTQGMCTPSRTSFLAGREAHEIGFGSLSISSAEYPNMNARMPLSAAMIPRHLRAANYSSICLGKWDSTPADELSVAGPFRRWPTGEGFDSFYGFHGPDADQWEPTVWLDTRPVQAPINDSNYHFTTDLANRAVEFVAQMKSSRREGRPFFMYWSTGAMHAPHQAPQSYVDEYKGVFDEGFDVLRQRVLDQQIALGVVPPNTQLTDVVDELPRWADLSPVDRASFARQMEVYAGMLTHADAQFGRILDKLERVGELDNTIVVVLADNAASGEGGPNGVFNEYRDQNGLPAKRVENALRFQTWGQRDANDYPLYSAAWANFANTPFKLFKQTAFRGGQHVPLVVAWNDGIAPAERGTIRSQFVHISDVVPTLLEAAGVRPLAEVDGVAQQPISGKSFLHTFNTPSAVSQRNKQVFEIYGNRGLYWRDPATGDEWKAVTLTAGRLPWQLGGFEANQFDEDVFELYNLTADFSEAVNLAAVYPDRLQTMLDEFECEAWRTNVFPLDNNISARGLRNYVLSTPPGGQKTYYGGANVRVQEFGMPAFKNNSYSLAFHLTCAGCAEERGGVLAAAGGITGGWALRVLADQRVEYVHNFLATQRFTVTSDVPVPLTADGASGVLLFRFDKTPTKATPLAGVVSMAFNGQSLITPGPAKGFIPLTVPFTYSYSETFNVGHDDGSPVWRGLYPIPSKLFGFDLDKVIVNWDT